MTSYQLTIPAENKPGSLARVTSILAEAKINIRAITITSFGEKGFFHLVVDDPKYAHSLLKEKGIPNELTEVLAILIDDKPGSLDRLVQLLAQEHINCNNAYGFVLESRKHAVFVVDVDKMTEAQTLLSKAGYKTLSEDELNSIEPFHYMRY
ncbi:MAG: ACT domain-containing protein [Spirochaetes bacterium]|nr:ACT domain-containing protein [Spirochaetota bacterium]